MDEELEGQEQYYRELRGIAKGTIVGLGEKVGARLVWMVSTLIMTRTLGAEDFGLSGLRRTVSTMTAHIGGLSACLRPWFALSAWQMQDERRKIGETAHNHVAENLIFSSPKDTAARIDRICRRALTDKGRV